MRSRDLAGTAFVGACLAVGLFFRVFYNYGDVFGGPLVRFAENDPWFHMRLVDHLVHHFPHRLTYDPYLIVHGQNVETAPLFDLIVASVALAAGGGSNPAIVERVAAFVPALFGALTVIPAYGLASLLFSRRAGFFAAALAATLPGEFLMRTKLGFVDHHAAEILFSACTLLFLVRAVESLRWLNAVIAGVFLGLYMLSWQGGALMVFALIAGGAMFIAIEGFAGRSSAAVVDTIITTLAIAAVMIAPLVPARNTYPFVYLHLAALGGGALIIGLMGTASTAAARSPARRAWIMAGAIVGVGTVAVAGLLLRPDLANAIQGQLGRLKGFTGYRVDEATPLTAFSFAAPIIPLREFGPSVLLALAGAWSAARSIFGGGRPGRALLLGVFAVAVVASIGQVRFNYYLAIPIAVLAGTVCDRLMTRAGKHAETALLALLVVVFVPNAYLAPLRLRLAPGPSDQWIASLDWLRQNSPEPFGRDIYQESYAGFSEANRHPALRMGYGVAAWWNRGYWIARIAHRAPIANATQAGTQRVAEIFLSEGDADSTAALFRYRSRYVIVDDAMPALAAPGPGAPIIYGVIPDSLGRLGRDAKNYYEIYDEPHGDGTVGRRLLYYPPYYRTLGVRLQAFGTDRVQPATVPVVVYRDQPGGNKRIEEIKSFASEDAAAEFVRTSTRPARIVGLDPFTTCVSLEPLDHVRPIYGLPPEVDPEGVQIFELVNWRPPSS